MLTVGILNPGAMGASVGAALAAAGHRVLWSAAGRSEATRKRAARAALIEVADLAAVVRESAWIVSVCPPAAAPEVAEQVRSAGFGGLYVDANAISPQTSPGQRNPSGSSRLSKGRLMRTNPVTMRWSGWGDGAGCVGS